MKKEFILAIMLLIAAMSSTLHAQSKPFSITAQVGYNNSHFSYDKRSDNKDASSVSGFQVGAVAEYSFAKYLFVDLGLAFTQYGDKSSGKDEGVKWSETSLINGLELAPNFGFRLPLGSFRPFVKVGIYDRIAFGGKYKLKYGSEKESENIKFGSKDGEIKNNDFGVNIGLGVDFKKHYILSFNYGFGLTGLINGDIDSKDQYHNRQFAVCVGYRF